MISADPDYGIHPSRKPAEELLICAILSRAIHDLFGVVGLTANQAERETAKHDALSFLTEPTGGWAQRRNELCDAIGFDGDAVRVRVIRVLEGDTSAPDTYDGRGALSDVAGARALWERQKQAIHRVRADKEKQATRPRYKVSRYKDVRNIILPLLKQPQTFKELIFATEGDVSDSTIRMVLNNAIDKGEVVRDADTHVYSLLPETAVAAATG